MTILESSPTAGRTDVSPVAGLDLGIQSERDADALAHGLQAGPGLVGMSGLVIASHGMSVEGSRRIALTVEAAGIDVERLWELLAATHEDGVPPTVLVGDRYEGPADVRSALGKAVAAHQSRSSGRVVVFPGGDTLTGALPVSVLLAGSSIDRVRVLAAGDADPGALVHTRDFVRPRWKDGELVLDVQPAAQQTLVPFETPFPTPCCAAH